MYYADDIKPIRDRTDSNYFDRKDVIDGNLSDVHRWTMWIRRLGREEVERWGSDVG